MGGASKPFLDLCGEPVLLRALRPFLAIPEVVAVRVALSEETMARVPEWLSALGPRVQAVRGGATRTESVRAALHALPDEAEIVVVHDAARPLVTEAVIRRCLEQAALGRGAIAAVPAIDTMKRVREDGSIVGTVDRSELRRAQTPQAFPREMFEAAYRGLEEGGRAPTDDAALVEAAGGRVVVVRGSPRNLKITTADDLLVAEALCRS
jgi:2-C-methyl-D-erythritol 4-phosphate cytidylyltransferase